MPVRFIFRELRKIFCRECCWICCEYFLASRRDTHKASARVLDELRFHEKCPRPARSIDDGALSPGRKHLASFLILQLKLILKKLHGIFERIFSSVFHKLQEWQEELFKFGDGHAGIIAQLSMVHPLFILIGHTHSLRSIARSTRWNAGDEWIVDNDEGRRANDKCQISNVKRFGNISWAGERAIPRQLGEGAGTLL